MERIHRRDALLTLGAVTMAGVHFSSSVAHGACSYFAAESRDINQPSQLAFINWQPDKKQESFTVQPKFEGNAKDFGMVIPTPSQPKLDEMPRDFFRALAVFSILEPMPMEKFKRLRRRSGKGNVPPKSETVVVLEEGVVGSLDYKIIKAQESRALFQWLKDHGYSYAGDESTLQHYVEKNWLFTVMKIDPNQMKRQADGSYQGNVSPTRFSFASEKLVYPLRITQISVKEYTEALFYVQAPTKVDLADELSYQFSWQPMWLQGMNWAATLSTEESRWFKHVRKHLPELKRRLAALQGDQVQPTSLEFAKRLTANDIKVVGGLSEYNREAPPAEIAKLMLLQGHLQENTFLTKFRKVFHRREMTKDLELAPAVIDGEQDPTEYYYALPTSPP